MPEVEEVVPVKGERTMKERLSELTPDEKTKLKEYMDAIKEIKKEIYELLHKDQVEEAGGNMSSGLTLKSEAGGFPFEKRDIIQLTSPINGTNHRIPNDMDFQPGEEFQILDVDDDYVVCRWVGETNPNFQIWGFDREELENSISNIRR